MLQTMWRKVTGVQRMPHHMLALLCVPAYSLRDTEMRPVTKISIFGVRLGIAVLAAYWCLIFIGTHLPGVAMVAPRVSDKWQHFTAFFFLGVLLCYVTNSRRWWLRFTGIGLTGMAYGAIDEFTQQWVPGRYSDLHDFYADSLGVWTAVLAYIALKYTWAIVQGPQET